MAGRHISLRVFLNSLRICGDTDFLVHMHRRGQLYGLLSFICFAFEGELRFTSRGGTQLFDRLLYRL